MPHAARVLPLLACVCVLLACGGKSESAGRDGGSIAHDDAVPAEAVLEADRDRVDFGRLVLGTTGVATLTLTNRGASTSGVPTVSARLLDEPDAGIAEPVAATGCDAALPPGGSCVLEITVTPAVLGTFGGNVYIEAVPGTESPSFSYLWVPFSGEAIGFEVSPTGDVALGDVAPGVSITRSFTITALIDLSKLAFSTYADGQELVIDRSVSTCTAVLAKGASCDITVVFLASTIGWKAGLLRIQSGGQLAVIHVTANVSWSSNLAIAPSTPTTLICVSTQIGPPTVFTVTNVGPTASGTLAATIVGSVSERFVVSQTDCAVLAPRATCTVAVVCDGTGPSAAWPIGTLTVTDGDTHLSVPLRTDGFLWP